jgi:hypothetical protein
MTAKEATELYQQNIGKTYHINGILQNIKSKCEQGERQIDVEIFPKDPHLPQTIKYLEDLGYDVTTDMSMGPYPRGRIYRMYIRWG